MVAAIAGFFRRMVYSRQGRTAARMYHGIVWNIVAGIMIARLLEPDDRGYVAVVVTATGLIGLLATVGIGTAYRARARGDAREELGNFRRIANILAVVLCMPTLLIGAYLTGLSVDDKATTIHGGLLFLATGLAWFFRQTTSECMAAFGAIQQGAAITVKGSALLTILVVAAISIPPSARADYIIAAYAASTWFKNLLAWMWMKSQRVEAGPVTGKGVFTLLKHGSGTIGFTFGQELTFRLDRYLIAALAGTRGAGMYTVATTPAELLRLPTNVVGQYAMLDSSRGTLPTKRLFVIGLACSGPALIAIPMAHLWGEHVLTAMYGDSYRPAAPILTALVAGQALLAPYIVWSRALAGAGNRLHISLGGIIGLGVLTVGCVLLIPGQGALGGAYAVTLAYATLSLVAGLSLHRHSGVRK